MDYVKDYKVEISKLSNEDGGGYLAYIPLIECYGDGETAEDAIAEVYSVAEALIKIAVEDGKEIPQPQYYKDEYEFSGKLSVRLPKNLHKQVSERAKVEDCSINQLISTYIAMGVGDAFGRTENVLEMQEVNAWKIAMLSSINTDNWQDSYNQQYFHVEPSVELKRRGRKHETRI